jgi:hypothetical protein
VARAGFFIQLELLDYSSKLRFIRSNLGGQPVAVSPRLFLSPRYAFGTPGHFEPLADQVFGQRLIRSRKTGVDVLLDLLHRRRHLLRFPRESLHARVQFFEPTLVYGNILFHIAYGLFDHLLGLFETIEKAMQICFE